MACIVTTGYWDSPFILMLLTAISVAGFARGFAFALRIAIVSTLAVTLPYLLESTAPERIVQSGRWTLVLLLVALIAGYGRRISGEADRQHVLALDRMGRLADANALLYSLHRVTQTLPASLDLDDVLQTTITRLRGLLDFDGAVILGLDDTDGHWEVLRRERGGPCHRDSPWPISPRHYDVCSATVACSPCRVSPQRAGPASPLGPIPASTASSRPVVG